MSKTLIEQALETADETEAIVIGYDVLRETGPMFKELFPGMRCLLVADENTYAAAGEPVTESLRDAGVEMVEPYIFPGTPTLYADYDNVSLVRDHLATLENTAICTVAAGTLNDIVKLASGELDRHYLVVCTAASVDGYASFGASISKDGFKITRNCPAPLGLVADLQVMADAPQRLTATGYGDLIEKIPAGADWILADELGIEAVDDYVWGLVQGPLKEALGRPEATAQGDADAIAGLAEGNIMSGLAMQAAKSSRPASGAGHQFSHTWEMEGHGLDWEPPLSHGFKVGVGTVASLALWEEAMKLDLDNLDIDTIVEAAPTDEQVESRVREYLDDRIADEGVTHSVEKNLRGEELRARLELIREKWPVIKERVADQLVSPEEAAQNLKAAAAPYHPEMIDVDWERFRKTHTQAQMIRPRYTIFDVLADLGILEETTDKLFEEDGFWGRHRHPESL